MAGSKAVTREDVRDIVFTPNDAVSLALETIASRRTTAGVGVRTGLSSLDEYLCPSRPGELIVVMGMSSNYKSGLMQYWARKAAQEVTQEQIIGQGAVYVTWEMAIEELLASDLAIAAGLSVMDIMQGHISDADMWTLQNQHGPRRAVTPLYLIGHSLKEGKRRPRLTLDTLGHGFQLVKNEFGLTPRIIFLDYLQQIDPGEGEDRRMQVFDNVARCKDMSLAMSCPVVIGCQANRGVYKQPWGVPGLSDGLETSNIEHTADKVLGVWLPKMTHEIGRIVEQGGREFTVTEDLLIIKVLKQRMGPSGKWFPFHVDLAHNEIVPFAS